MGQANGAERSKTGKGLPSSASKRLVDKWQQRQLASQVFAVARHDERADDTFAVMSDGSRWSTSDDFRKWPLDPPLSDIGVEAAAATGRRLVQLTEASGCTIHIVITSPYLRCIQTAAEICRALGPQTKLLLDRSIGEVYGPSVMGPNEPACPVRPTEHMHVYCVRRGVSAHHRVIGKWPTWPETLKDARKRYASRFLTYLHRSAMTKRNFMLVTHADCVAAALTLMPSQADNAVDLIDYGGLFFGKRRQIEPKTPKRRMSLNSMSSLASKGAASTSFMSRSSRNKDLVSIMPSGDAADSCDDVDGNADPARDFLPDSETEDMAFDDAPPMSTIPSIGATQDADKEETVLQTPEDGWQVFTCRIQLRKKKPAAVPATGRTSMFTRKVKALIETSAYTSDHIERLLGELGDEPLGGSCTEHSNAASAMQQSSAASGVSFSTFLFGTSDVANQSDLGERSLSLGEFEDWDKVSLGSRRSSHKGSMGFRTHRRPSIKSSRTETSQGSDSISTNHWDQSYSSGGPSPQYVPQRRLSTSSGTTASSVSTDKSESGSSNNVNFVNSPRRSLDNHSPIRDSRKHSGHSGDKSSQIHWGTKSKPSQADNSPSRRSNNSPIRDSRKPSLSSETRNKVRWATHAADKSPVPSRDGTPNQSICSTLDERSLLGPKADSSPSRNGKRSGRDSPPSRRRDGALPERPESLRESNRLHSGNAHRSTPATIVEKSSVAENVAVSLASLETSTLQRRRSNNSINMPSLTISAKPAEGTISRRAEDLSPPKPPESKEPPKLVINASSIATRRKSEGLSLDIQVPGRPGKIMTQPTTQAAEQESGNPQIFSMRSQGAAGMMADSSCTMQSAVKRAAEAAQSFPQGEKLAQDAKSNSPSRSSPSRSSPSRSNHSAEFYSPDGDHGSADYLFMAPT